MKTLFSTFAKEPEQLHICYDLQKDKMRIFKDSEFNCKDENLNCVFTLTSYLIGILHTLKIPYSLAKKRLMKAIFNDLSTGNNFNKNSNLYNVLVNEFGIKVRAFNNFVSC